MGGGKTTRTEENDDDDSFEQHAETIFSNCSIAASAKLKSAAATAPTPRPAVALLWRGRQSEAATELRLGVNFGTFFDKLG